MIVYNHRLLYSIADINQSMINRQFVSKSILLLEKKIIFYKKL